MEIKFFKYENNCDEYKTLVKATSENASRNEVKVGQKLFKSICQNIIVISKQLHNIENTILNRKIEITGSEEKEYVETTIFQIEYYSNRVENDLNRNRGEDLEFIGTLFSHIHDILKYLDSHFDHEEHEKEIKDIQKIIKENKPHDSYAQYRYGKTDYNIQKSIKAVLKHYSAISKHLIDYIYVFQNYKNQPY